MSEKQTPFVPGARVAYQRWRDSGWQERFVEKTYKSGRFTLKGGNGQQWRPSSYCLGDGPVVWTAHPTGDHYSRTYIKLWTPETDKEISRAIAETKRRDRWLELRHSLDRLRLDDLTDAMLDAIETALPKKAPTP